MINNSLTSDYSFTHPKDNTFPSNIHKKNTDSLINNSWEFASLHTPERRNHSNVAQTSFDMLFNVWHQLNNTEGRLLWKN